MSTRKQVYKAIDSERLLQSLMIQAETGSKREHKPLESFALHIGDYTRELSAQLTRVWGPQADISALDTIRKIAALCVAAMELHGAQPRKFPVRVRINGKLFDIHPKGTKLVDTEEYLFGKREGAAARMEPRKQKGRRRRLKGHNSSRCVSPNSHSGECK